LPFHLQSFIPLIEAKLIYDLTQIWGLLSLAFQPKTSLLAPLGLLRTGVTRYLYDLTSRGAERHLSDAKRRVFGLSSMYKYTAIAF
jgi:hypothetical protein